MGQASNNQKLANRSDTSGAQPMPTLKFPPLPQRIAQIDPQGAAAYTQQLNQAFSDWVDKLNVVTNGLAGQIKTS